jgi:hypothetical protein
MRVRQVARLRVVREERRERKVGLASWKEKSCRESQSRVRVVMRWKRGGGRVRVRVCREERAVTS